MKFYNCTICIYQWSSKREAERCYICGRTTDHQPCDECFSYRHCDACHTIHENEEPREGMRYGCSEEGLEDTICHACWLDLQHPLVKLGECADLPCE